MFQTASILSTDTGTCLLFRLGLAAPNSTIQHPWRAVGVPLLDLCLFTGIHLLARAAGTCRPCVVGTSLCKHHAFPWPFAGFVSLLTTSCCCLVTLSVLVLPILFPTDYFFGCTYRALFTGILPSSPLPGHYSLAYILPIAELRSYI